MNNNKKIVTIVTIVAIIIASIGIAYGAFTYSRGGTYTNKLVAGDIYMRYKEGTGLTFENAVPTSGPVEGKYFEFEIIGKNTYTEKDIIYDIVINHGDDHATRTERIDDKFLKFKLVEVAEDPTTHEKTEVAEPLLNNKTYNTINNTRIYVARIPKNTGSEIKKIYRLYAWIDDSIRIGTGGDYELSTWNNQVYASIKVNVTGDFNEKELGTPSACFATGRTLKGTVKTNMSNSEMNECIDYFSGKSFDTGTTAQSFCEGTGTASGLTIQQVLDGYWDDSLHDIEERGFISVTNAAMIKNYDASCGSNVVIPSSLPVVLPNNITLNTNNDSAAMDACLALFAETPFDEGTTVQSFCEGTGTLDGDTILDLISTSGNDAINYTLERGIITVNSNPSNFPVTKIDQDAFNNKGLTSVVIPNSINYIDDSAFLSNNIQSFEVPSQLFNNNICHLFDYKVTVISGNDSLVCSGR